MSSQASWNPGNAHFQQSFAEEWAKAFSAWPAWPAATAGTGVAPALQFDQAQLQALQQAYVQAASKLWAGGLSGTTPLQDKRFANPAWLSQPTASLTAASYLLNGKALMAMAEAIQVDEKTKQRIRFAVEQWVAATSPSNYLALNPEAQQIAIASRGESLAKGIQNLLHDMEQGHVSMTDESAFELGKNVATTEGAVVYENEFFQLIEYKPLTDKVHARPLLLVPPCINKYYILDLQPENSLVRYAISQGHRTLVMSWRNPDESHGHWTWDDYIEHAVLEAIRVTQEIAGADQINALGFCVGGTMLTTALSVLAARGEKSVASATLLTTFVDFSDTGVLDVFIDEAFVQMREMQMGQGGLLKGQELASTFSFLRPNDLVWNYVVGNYLKGETPPPFDLLYWNCDATNLPGPWYAWYLRNMYLENNLIQPEKLTVCGQQLNVGNIEVPLYVYGSRDDHIVPIAAAYATTQQVSSPVRFVMGASGHIAGVINPPAKNKRSHWVRDDAALPASHTQWLEGATQLPGSWWGDWSHWLASHAGKLVAAPQRYGRGRKYPAIEAAPGRYAQQKA